MNIKIYTKSGTVFEFDDMDQGKIDELEDSIFCRRGGYVTLMTMKETTKIKIDEIETLVIDK